MSEHDNVYESPTLHMSGCALMTGHAGAVENPVVTGWYYV